MKHKQLIFLITIIFYFHNFPGNSFGFDLGGALQSLEDGLNKATEELNKGLQELDANQSCKEVINDMGDSTMICEPKEKQKGLEEPQQNNAKRIVKRKGLESPNKNKIINLFRKPVVGGTAGSEVSRKRRAKKGNTTVLRKEEIDRLERTRIYYGEKKLYEESFKKINGVKKKPYDMKWEEDCLEYITLRNPESEKHQRAVNTLMDFYALDDVQRSGLLIVHDEAYKIIERCNLNTYKLWSNRSTNSCFVKHMATPRAKKLQYYRITENMIEKLFVCSEASKEDRFNLNSTSQENEKRVVIGAGLESPKTNKIIKLFRMQISKKVLLAYEEQLREKKVSNDTFPYSSAYSALIPANVYKKEIQKSKSSRPIKKAESPPCLPHEERLDNGSCYCQPGVGRLDLTCNYTAGKTHKQRWEYEMKCDKLYMVSSLLSPTSQNVKELGWSVSKQDKFIFTIKSNDREKELQKEYFIDMNSNSSSYATNGFRVDGKCFTRLGEG
jgi:hypothetical protein